MGRISSRSILSSIHLQIPFMSITRTRGARKRRERYLICFFFLFLLLQIVLIFCSGYHPTAFLSVTNSSCAPSKPAHITSINLCASLAFASAQPSSSRSSFPSSDLPSTSFSPTPSSSAKRAKPISPPGSSAV